MADPWELILHHTYRGAPGLVYDCSPGKGSHGVAVGAVQFHPDGASPGSASISFPNRASYVHVDGTKGWDHLDALRAEVVCNLVFPGPDTFFQTLIQCPSFFWGTYHVHYQGEHLLDTLVLLKGPNNSRLVLRAARLPVQRWTTLAFEYDGWNRLQLSVDGAVVKSATGTFGPLPGASPMPVDIGGFGSGWGPYQGRIDDIKIWRRNPRALSQDFLNRPMDSETAECWARWGRRLRDWLAENPRCAAELAGQLGPLYQAVHAIDDDDELRRQFRRIGEIYRREWVAGTLTSEEMIRAGAEAGRLLERVGYPAELIEVVLNESDCWRRLVTEVPPPDCDHQFADLMRETARELEGGRRSWPERH
ncbi:LamG-like jellyroll fold domain-containing protein [Mycolicibacterium sp. 120270]|uniref:LamG-like jellyroll fold domain-containing protein n=1 Tax=Mycolicibacterium sp. 120270 TaxID=3090600 RepID=UPI00299D3F4B|nr:LamG-like jellyroll fold domain-containing protein [Mycolicibacterium sp. 120270]MDX1883227.1 LamG-like jellyroll fold domain-containing protein [Mycolicibacterium sp. 120270]